MLKRAKDQPYPGQWELPGGKLDELETLQDSLRREVFEETGLIINVVEPVVHTDSTVLSKGRYKGHTYISVISRANLEGGKIKLSPEEHDDYKWVTKSEILNLDLAPYGKLPLTELLLKK